MKSPGDLFISLWQELVELAPHHRALAEKPPDGASGEILKALRKHDGYEAVEELNLILGLAAAGGADRLRRVKLEMMRGIDYAYLEIHPRSLNVGGRSHSLQQWLREASTQRYMSGFYACDDDGRRLIARGPLLRSQRASDASSADSLADRFAALAVTGMFLSQEGRKIFVSHTVKDSSKIDGVELGLRAGEEKVAFLAVAQSPTELKVSHKAVGGANFVEFKTNGEFDVVDRVIRGLKCTPDHDICLAPELVVSAQDALSLRKRMPYETISTRIFIAGSGQSLDIDDSNLAWNETQVVNSIGNLLWDQRKLWPASITHERLKELSDGHSSDGRCLEHNAASNEVKIVDVDGLGRCVVLICQDFNAEPLVTNIIQDYQPDWVFVPIMDSDVKPGRWCHQRAFAQSGLSRARFLMATNTAYNRKIGDSAPSVMALAIGPLDQDLNDQGRMCTSLFAKQSDGIEYTNVQWRSDGPEWQITFLSRSPSRN